jgi:vancomycin resistance protein YoaR
LQRTTRLSRDDLGRSVRFSLQPGGAISTAFSGEALLETFGNRARRLSQEPRDASLEVNEAGKLSPVAEAEGLAIEWDTLAARLTEAGRAGLREVEIPHRSSGTPKRHAAEVEALGIKEPLGTFATRHACCQPRVSNIHRIAELINSTIVMPGEVFSLNQHVGKRTIENGFVSAPGIEDGDMRDSVGGGVSQFTTTFYNAVLRAGLEILERQAHSYWFERYPMGHEATLSWPKPDFVWKNDSPTAVLIACSFTERSITVALWGKSDGRRVAFGASSPMEAVAPPIEMLPNSEIDPEKEKTKDGGRMGFSVMTTRTVTMPDKTTRTDRRKVTYKPQVRRVEVHPCRIKQGEPGYTGERCPLPDAGAPEAPVEAAP